MNGGDKLKIIAKDSTARLVVNGILIVIFFSLLLYYTYTLIDKMGITKKNIILLLIIFIIIIFQLREFVILHMSNNYELVLEDKYFVYRSLFTNYTIKYTKIRKMKIVKHTLGRFGGYKYFLIIKVGRLNRIYISTDSINTKQFNALKTVLMNRTGNDITDKRRKFR